MRTVCALLLALFTTLCLVSLSAGVRGDAGAQRNRRPRQNQPPPPLPPRNSNAPGEHEPHQLPSPTPCPAPHEGSCVGDRTKVPKAFVVEFPGPDGMTLRGYMSVPGVKTQAQFDALTRPRAGLSSGKTGNANKGGGGLPPTTLAFPAVIHNHGSEPEPTCAPHLAEFYVSRGFVFFSPHRHGQGLSKDAGPYHVDEQNKFKGKENFGEMDVKLHELYNRDVLAAVEWLKRQPYVNPSRIIMRGGSFGGIQTLLTAEKDPGLRAYLAFTPGADSWGVDELRARLRDAVRKEQPPLFIIQAEGDYSLGPVEELGAILATKNDLSRWRFKLYPKFGTTHEDAHALFGGTCAGIAVWQTDVLDFMDTWLK